MTPTEPTTELDARYSGEGAVATSWADARRHLEQAETFWVTTVRPDGRPHVTTLLSVWLDDALSFTTGAEEQKAKNLAAHPQCALVTGANALNEGLDLVVEGVATRLTDDAKLRRLAEAYEEKYGADWHFDVADGVFVAEGREALVFEVAPVTAYAFAKGRFSHTRYRFG